MTTTTSQSQDEETEEIFYTLDQLDHYELDNGAYVFIGNVKDICKHVDHIGLQIYYVYAYEKYSEPITNSTGTITGSTTKQRPQMFKVVNNFIGCSITPTNDVALDVIESAAWYALPKIPAVLIDKLDAFFRKVDEKHGIESIVLLTYDETKTGEDGWGVLIPKQENTAGDCDYKPDSIVDAKPDNVHIVGSVHSHPGMSAFASGKDHKDQADFDGLHITFGWQKSVQNGATQYHIELQMAGGAHRFDPEQIFADPPRPDTDLAEIDDWMENVSKKHSAPGYSYGSQSSSISPRGGSFSSGGTSSATAAQGRIKDYPKDAPDVTKNVVIAMLKDPEEDLCPFCQVKLVTLDTSKRRCLTCHQYLAFPGETVADIAKLRKGLNVFVHEIDVENKKPYQVIYMWTREEKKNVFTPVYVPEGVDLKK